MKCDKCEYEFSNDCIWEMLETKECPSCKNKVEDIKIKYGSEARLANSISFPVNEMYEENVIKEIREGVKEIFDRYGFDPSDFNLNIKILLKDLETENKYTIDEHKIVRFEK